MAPNLVQLKLSIKREYLTFQEYCEKYKLKNDLLSGLAQRDELNAFSIFEHEVDALRKTISSQIEIVEKEVRLEADAEAQARLASEETHVRIEAADLHELTKELKILKRILEELKAALEEQLSLIDNSQDIEDFRQEFPKFKEWVQKEESLLSNPNPLHPDENKIIRTIIAELKRLFPHDGKAA